MIETNQIDQIIGQSMYGSNQDKLGKVGQIYLDDVTGKPEWATVSTGLFGTSETFVPIRDASVSGDGLTVPYTKDQVKDAPRVNVDDDHLSEDQEAELYRHYGLQYSERESDSGLAAGRTSDRDLVDDDRARVGRDTVDTNTDDAMTRSEEQLKVGTERVQTGKARLRKYVVTEQQQVTVPVTREEVRIEREPITEANRGDAVEGPEISEAEHEVTLTEERPVVEKEAVPVERVRLAKETVTEDHHVSEEVRKEKIETDGDVNTAGFDTPDDRR